MMMETVDPVFWAALMAAVLPFASFALIIVLLRNHEKLAAGVSIGAISVSLIGAIFLLLTNWHMQGPVQYTVKWMVSGAIKIPVGILLDPLNLVMLVIVTAIAFLVQIYSLGYMAGDPGFSRYYAFMSLFAWAMISLTISPTMIQLYIFWELVGLASYLLIGFWYEKYSASQAGKKAFVMTRLGDVAFLLGLILVLVHLGNLDIRDMNDPGVSSVMSPALLTLSALLLFGGVVGKSAQFPLLTWLPDAMEGPTPVSALLHSATMVAAGVFMFARLFPFFSLSPTAMTVCLAIGTLSMLMASTMAMVSRDIKQVWAYSTISQLGFMIMALASGAYVAGVYHLATHAGFKALLFLCAGVFIHAFGTNDMFEIGQKGGRAMKIPMICMIIGAGALAGLPPFSGFFSKEAIMAGLAAKEIPLWLWAGILGIFLTAYYTFRLIFIIGFPRQLIKDTYGHHHESSAMTWPLVILSIITVVFGIAGTALEHFLALEPVADHGDGHPLILMVVCLGVALVGVALAWWEFGRKGAVQQGFVERIPPVRDLFANRWYLDRFYRWFLDTIVYKGLARAFAWNDNQVIDGIAHAIGRWAIRCGDVLAGWHMALIQPKLMMMFSVVFLLVLIFCF